MPTPPLPKNWPPSLPYLTTPLYSKTLTQEHKTFLKTQSTTPAPLPQIQIQPGPSPLVKITPILEPTHPAYSQSGLFATRDLKPGTFILCYMGEIHTSSPPPPTVFEEGGEINNEKQNQPLQTSEKDPHSTSNYDLSLSRDLGLGIDAAHAGNEARFINDYRGVAPRPNSEFKEIWDERRKERGMGVWVLPEGKKTNNKGGNGGKGKKGIKKGEEILVSYGRGFWGARKGEEEGVN